VGKRLHAHGNLDGGGFVVVVEAVERPNGAVGNVRVAEGAQGLKGEVEFLFSRDPRSVARHLLQLWHVLFHRAV
jgi:hypothetical protein